VNKGNSMQSGCALTAGQAPEQSPRLTVPLSRGWKHLGAVCCERARLRRVRSARPCGPATSENLDLRDVVAALAVLAMPDLPGCRERPVRGRSVLWRLG